MQPIKPLQSPTIKKKKSGAENIITAANTNFAVLSVMNQDSCQLNLDVTHLSQILPFTITL